jgi:predicted DNA-binding transcriptional regulator AlpA
MADNISAPVEARPFLHQEEAAKLLGVSTRSLERWRLTGDGPRFRKFGRRVVYARSDIFQYADCHAYQSTAEADAALEQRR